MSAPEFARAVRLDTLGGGARTIEIAADAVERAALSTRFGLIAIDRLEASVALIRDGETVYAEGRIVAGAVQSCIATGEPVPATIAEPFVLRFVPALDPGGEEIELDEGDLDTVTYDGGAIDLGEAVAQGFALALDAFPRSAAAEAYLRAAGVASEDEAEAARQAISPFAVLKGLGGG